MRNTLFSFLYICLTILFYFSTGDTYGADSILNTPQIGYRFSQSQISDITLADSSCVKITNNGTDRFIPTKTMAEWVSFSNLAAFLGVGIGSCIVPTCTDSIKNGTETGVDCGGTCAACPPSYSWQTGSYGACSASCGPGTKSRSVWCERNDGVTVANGLCGGGKPSTSSSCNDGACPPTCTDGIKNQSETEVDCGGPNCSACIVHTYAWEAEYPPWYEENCSNTCGAGTEPQRVFCVDQITSSTVADSNCTSPKPAPATRACTNYSTCQCNYHGGTWGWEGTGIGSGPCGSSSSYSAYNGQNINVSNTRAGYAGTLTMTCHVDQGTGAKHWSTGASWIVCSSD